MAEQEFNKQQEVINAEKLNEEIKETEEKNNNNSKNLLGQKRSNDSTERTREKNYGQVTFNEQFQSSKPQILKPKKIFKIISNEGKKEKLNNKFKRERKEKHSTNVNIISDNFLFLEGCFSGSKNEIFEEKIRIVKNEYEATITELIKLKKENKSKNEEYKKLKKKKIKLKTYYSILNNLKKISDLGLENYRDLIREIQLEEGIDNLSNLTNDSLSKRRTDDLCTRKCLQLSNDLNGFIILYSDGK